jgi:uncharacterized protein YkwD
MRSRAALRHILVICALVLSGEAVAATEVCGDHDGNGSVATSDALRLLRNAVGQDVTLDCPNVCAIPFCGDQSCEEGESCADCATDCGSCSGCAGAGDATTALDAEEQAFLALLNDYRGDDGKDPVEVCVSLSRAAQGHSEDMRDDDYFSNTGDDGTDLYERACNACYELGCGPQVAMAQLIAAGNAGATATLAQWQDSAGERDMLRASNYTQIGIGRATGGGMYGSYWTILLAAAGEPSCN